MSNSTFDSRIVTLNLIQQNIGRYGYPFIIILGNIGSILNILVLTQRVYLKNPSSCYILASTITNLVIINILILARLLQLGFDIDPTTTSSFFCKFRVYIAHTMTLLSRFYMVLACVDRWAMTSTSVQRRSFSQIKVAKILIPSLAIVWCIISLHTVIEYSILNGRCIQMPGIYPIFYSIYNTILSGVSIPMLMLVFGILTIRNIKHSRQRINARTIPNQYVRNNIKLRENGISVMILAQLGVYLISCIPFPMYSMYSTVTINWTKSSFQLALDNFYSTIANTLPFINFSATFYIYVLTTHIFRKDLKRLLLKKKLCKLCFHAEENVRIIAVPGNGTVEYVINQAYQGTI